MRFFPMLLALGSCLPLAAARAEDEPKVHRVWAEAQAEAKAEKRLLFAFVGAGAEDPHALIASGIARVLAPDHVLAAVSWRVGDAGGEPLRVRYHLLHDRAALLAFTADGALLVEAPVPKDAEAARGWMTTVEERAREYAKERAALEARPQPDALPDLLDFHLDHRDMDLVLSLCRKAISLGSVPLRVLGAYASALGATGDGAREAEALGRMLDGWPEEPGSVEWRIRRATAHLSAFRRAMAREARPQGDGVRGPGADAMRQLLEEDRRERKGANEGRIRYEIVDSYSSSLAESLAHASWIVEHDAGAWYGIAARAYLAKTLDWLGESEAARVHYEALALFGNRGAAEGAAARAQELRGPAGKGSPLAFEARVEPAAPAVGSPAKLVVAVGAPPKGTFEGLTLSVVAYGPYEPRTQQEVRLEPLGDGAVDETTFEFVATAASEIHLVARVEGPGAGTRGRWLRLQPH